MMNHAMRVGKIIVMSQIGVFVFRQHSLITNLTNTEKRKKGRRKRRRRRRRRRRMKETYKLHRGAIFLPDAEPRSKPLTEDRTVHGYIRHT
jgi:hypothetical protein